MVSHQCGSSEFFQPTSLVILFTAARKGTEKRVSHFLEVQRSYEKNRHSCDKRLLAAGKTHTGRALSGSVTALVAGLACVGKVSHTPHI